MIWTDGFNPAFVSPLAFGWRFLEFSDPAWLALLLLLVPLVYLWRTSRVPATPARRRISLALRVLLVVSLVLALSGARLIWNNKGICVAFLVDDSQSVPADLRDAMRARMAEEIQTMSRDDQFVVIEFAGDAVLDSLPSFKGPLRQPSTLSDTGRTDLARALRLAMASFPADRQKRVVLFSDGNQNVGDAIHETRILAANDIDVDVVPLRAQAGHEVMVEQLVLPNRVQKNARFQARAIVSADQAQGATLRVLRDGELLSSQQVQLKEGTNVFDLHDALADGGTHQYAVSIEPASGSAADTFAANNTAYGFTQVDAPGKVLVVRGNPRERDYISQSLLENNIQTETALPDNLPGTLGGFNPYDCVVLENVPADRLSQAQMRELKKWVTDVGGGLVIVGGDNSFGPGGYKGTALEDISPVEMDVKRKKHLASLAMVIVLDKSGSMGAPAGGGTNLCKMDLANNGAVQTLKLLDESDEALIGAVDTEVKWQSNSSALLPMNEHNKKLLRETTLTNQPGGGGIYAYTALIHAYRAITAPRVQAMSRHVILFADTQDTEQQEGCLELAKKYRNMEPSVTTSVIGLGVMGDSDVPFQQQLAKVGGGRFYVTDDATRLPSIFAKEAFIAARNAFVEKREGISLQPYRSPLLDSFRDVGLPRIYGYVGTTLKPRATLAAHGLEPDDPVLAHWSVGLGKCVVYTSDATARWGKDWVTWAGFSKFWGQTVRWASRSVQNSQLATTTSIDGNEGHVVVEATGSDGKPLNNLQLEGNVISPDPDDRTMRAQLVQVAPGRYEGKFSISKSGTYMVTVVDQKSATPVDSAGATMSYPPEFRDLTPNTALLKKIAEVSGGRVLETPGELFVPKPQPVRSFRLLWERLILLSLIGLLADVAWRRLNVADWFQRRRATVLAAASGSAIGALKQVRLGRQEVQDQRERLQGRPAAGLPSHAVMPEPERAAAPSSIPASAPATPTSAVPAASEQGGGYASRLMHAKRRAAEQIRESQEGNSKS